MRVKYTVTVRNYYFHPPTDIPEAVYNYYKDLIKANPNAKLNAKLPENLVKKGLKVAFMAALSPLMLLSPGTLEGEIKSGINKMRAQSDENEFYRKLKEIVIRSTSYQEFRELFKRLK